MPAREQKDGAREESHVILHPHSFLWLRLSKLQERHGRGQLLTQTPLGQGFSPLPLYLTSASRRNSCEDGDADLRAGTKEPWGWGCPGSVTAAVTLGGKQTVGIKVTEESEDIILKRTSAAQDCLVQCC